MKPYPRYKPTGLAWLPSVPEHWEVKRLKNLFEERKEANREGKTTNVLSLLKDVGVIPYEDKGNIGNKSKEDITQYKIAHKGDLVLNSMNVIIGSVGVSEYDGCVSPVYYALRPRAGTDAKYYANLMRLPSVQKTIRGRANGILEIRLRISAGALLDLPFPVPPPDEQTRIVQYLDEKTAAIDELVRAKEREIELLRERKQALVSAAVTRGLDPATKLKDSGVPWIGKIPAHWEVTKIKHLFQEVDERNTMLDAPLLSFSRTRGIIPFSELSEKDPAAGDLSLYKIIRPGLLLENRLQAWSGMFAAANAFGCVSPDYSVFKPSTNANIRFYEYVFRSPFQVSQFANASRGVGEGFNRLYTPQFGAILTVLPPFPEQARIVAYLDERTAAIDELVCAEERQIELLQELRTRLVSDAVTGAVEV